MTHLLILLFYLFHYGRAQVLVGTIPLVVRSPYLNCWSYSSQDEASITPSMVAANCDRSNWVLTEDASFLNLGILVRVDNVTYLAVGYTTTATHVLLTNTVVSPTQTKLIMEAGYMQFNITFLNPIEPEDWVKQSIPFSYLSLTAQSLDGAAHAVQVYSDISARWSPGVTYFTNSDDPNNVVYHAIALGASFVYNEVSTQTGIYFAMENGVNVTYKISEETVSHELFERSGMLDEGTIANATFNDTEGAFALSRNLGTIQATQDPIVWVFGYTTDPAINYTDLSGASQQRSLYYKTKYPDDDFVESLIADFLYDFANASSRAQQLDQRILQDAAPISGMLGDLVSFATAQVYGSTQLTISMDSYGHYNESDVMAFMTNMGGLLTGDPYLPNRVNAVETLYSAFPAFMYIDPKLGGLYLEPLFRLQASPAYTNPYAAPDLGTSFPNVTISNSPHNQSIEESGNMLIMAYAHARASGDDSLIRRYYSLLTSWADYLSNTTLLTHDQVSADGLMADNQTNLAIKGIIAIKAMSKMSLIVNQTHDVDKYSSTAANFYAQWKSLALTGDNRLLAAYGQIDSWTIGYNLFADIWLGTNVVESSIYDGQSSFLNNLLTTNISNSEYATFIGMPIDNLGSDTNISASGWNLFVAAMTSNQDLLRNLISSVHRQGFIYGTTVYSPLLGSYSAGQGAMYAPLALKAPVLIANPTTTGTPKGTPLKPHKHRVSGGVIGGIAGGVAASLTIGTIALAVWHRRRQSHGRTSLGSSSLRESTDQGTHVTMTPFSPTMLTLTEAAPLAAGTQMDFHQRLFHRPSSMEDLPLPLRRMESVPVPVGLSSKELARLRSHGSRSQALDGPPPDPPLANTIGGDALEGAAVATTSLSEARRLQLETNFSRHEIQQLLVERSESPPSYASRP